MQTVAHVQKYFQSIFNSIQDVLFPKFCFSCKEEGVWLCEACERKLTPFVSNVCVLCQGVHGKATNHLCDPCRVESGLDAVHIGYDYNDPIIQKIVHGAKYQYVEALVEKMAEWMDQRMDLKAMTDDAVLTFVPLHKRKQLQRGFNQAELLAQHLARYGGAVSMDLLERTTYTQPQSELSREARLKNVKDVFQVKLATVPTKLIIVDDVFTTGATLSECAKLLKHHGAQHITALVFAKG